LPNSPANLTVHQEFLTADEGLVDCGAAPGTCVVAAADLSQPLVPSNIATAPLTFAHTAPPAVAVSDTTFNYDGEAVTFAAADYPPNQTAVVQQCGPDAGAGHCDTGNTISTTTGSKGSFFVKFVVHRMINTQAGVVDCAHTACLLTAPPGVTATASLTFFDTHLTVTPNTGLFDGQAVNLTFSGYPGAPTSAECLPSVTGPAESGACDISTANFGGGSFTVRRHITVGVPPQAVDCAASAGACVIAAANIQGLRATLKTVALTFAPVTSIVVPTTNAPLSGKQLLAADAVGPTAGVDFRLFGNGIYYNKLVGASTPTRFGWLYDWDTTSVPDGAYQLASRAFDTTGTSTYSPTVTVDVKNLAANVALPLNGAVIKRERTLLAAGAEGPVAGVDFRLFGGGRYFNALIGAATPTRLGWLLNWETEGVANGTYQIAARAFDTAGRSAYSATVTVTLEGDRQSPSPAP
jgi:hypothetical protein